MKEGTILGGRYEILSKIGSGGMSDVYKAHCMVLNRMVAIKVLKPEFSADKTFVAKFRREAQAAAGLSHPNVVNVYDVSEEGDLYYIVMELIEGITLKRYIERKGKMKVRESVEVAMQIAKGLEAAHAQGIIHRDIKPQNIMISREGKIKVTDFGIARITTAQTTSTDTMGSVHYISPEQARGGYCDERSDIYSLGITLYEMLTGVVPFNGETSIAVALQHIQGEMTPLREVDPEIPESLEKIVQKCTQKKPELRYATMTALLDDLRRFIADPDGTFVVIPAAGPEGSGGAETAGGEAKSPEEAVVVPPPVREKPRRDEEEEVEEAIASRKAKRTENILTYTMIGVGLVILIIIIAILLRACGMFFPTEGTVPTGRPTEAHTPASSNVQPSTGRPTVPPAESSTEQPTSGTSASSAPTDPAETEGPTETEQASSDATKTVMPYVVGKSYSEAVQILEALGLTTIPELVPAPAGSSYGILDVCDQEFPEGTELEKGSAVTLSVIGNSSAVIIPQSLMGMNTTDAKTALIQLGLRVADDYTWTNNEYVSYGKVVDSYPSLGSVVDKGTSVQLILSLGPAPKLTVPDITGDTEKDALDKLKNAGLKPGNVTYEYHNTILKDRIISQSPEANDQVSADTKIDFVISLGRPVMPDILGKTPEEAEKLLKELSLSVGTTIETFSSKVPEGRVVSAQTESGVSVKAGDTLRVGDVLNLFVSKGPESTVMDDWIDQKAVDAQTFLEDAMNGGFKVVWKNNKKPGPNDLVVKTEPEAGEELFYGSEIVITYGAPVEIPDVFEMTVADAVELLEFKGFQVEFPDGEPEGDALVLTIDPPHTDEDGNVTVVGAGRTVKLTYDKAVEVPDVVGMTVEQAQIALLQLRLIPVFEDDIRPETGATVIATDPPAGALLKQDEKVTISYENPEVPPVTYTVTWVVDGNILATSWEEGTVPAYMGTPSKAADAQFFYEFIGWSPEITEVTADVTYTAQFSQTPRTYTITWMNGDGSTLKTEEVAYGRTPAYSGTTPTKPATAEYTYVFNGTWSPSPAPVTGPAAYTAQFNQTDRMYTVIWKDGNGNVLKSEEKTYGSMPSYNGATPTKTGNAQYSYTFTGWSPSPSAVTGDVTYTAQFSQTVNTYTVTWIVDGNVTTETYHYDDMPSFKGSVDKASDGEFSYSFAGWSPEVVHVTGDAAYTAVYEQTPLPTEETNAQPSPDGPSEGESPADGTGT